MSILTKLKRRGKARMKKFLQRLEPMLFDLAVAQRLGLTVDAVNKHRLDGKLLAVRRGSEYLYPKVQFVGSQAAPWVPELIGFLGPETALGFLAVRRISLDNKSFAEMLAEDPANSEVVEEMLEAARRYESSWV